MRVMVWTVSCPFDTEIERLCGLFFDTAEIVIEDFTHQRPRSQKCSSPPDVTVELRLATLSQACTADATLWYGDHSKKASTTTSIAKGCTPVAVRKKSKQVVLHVLHDVLEQFVGEGQPWGILTGMRPMKLVHQMVQKGHPLQEIRRELLQIYRITTERVDLLLDILEHQRRVVPDLYALDDAVSLYIGIPFCPTHCAYCTFPAYSMTDKATYVADFLKAMDVEFAHLGELLRGYEVPVTSVYIGGGTPTSLRAPELEHLFETLYREIPGYSTWRELTVEAGRPDTITPDRVKVMKQYGTTRISVNPQTFKAATLKEIGRGHTPDIVDHRFHYVRDAGFDNINMDVILGLPGESLDDVRYTMERIQRLNPESITVHTMSFKRSALVNQARSRFRIPATDVVRQMMIETSSTVRGLGYDPYYIYRQKDILGNLENVGFARRGKESVYNIVIMEERQTIVGIGGGAVTKLVGRSGKNFGRFANPREPKAFIETVNSFVAKKDVALRRVFDEIRATQPSQSTLL